MSTHKVIETIATKDLGKERGRIYISVAHAFDHLLAILIVQSSGVL
jgi:hypothetical protein